MSPLTRLPDRPLLAMAGILIWSFLISSASAQITPDATLNAERSIVTNQTIRTLPSQLIQGGAIRGGNLFHSFEQFNVGNGQGTYFANPTGITNILTRVTGSNLSRIDGTLGVLGNANLFILNPNGILFGSGARLDLSGSFAASTAGSIGLGHSGSFNAIVPDQSNLLSIKPNVYFTTANQTQSSQIKAIGDLTNSGNLQVNLEQNLSLYGATVYQFGNLTAPGGKVEVLGDRVGLMAGSSIDVSAPIQAGTVLVGGDLKGFGTVPLAQVTYVDQNATINANAIGLANQNGNGGQVIIWGDQTLRAYGTINAKGMGTGSGGFVETSSRGHLNVSGLKVNVQAPTLAGTWLIDPHNVILNYDYQAVNPLLAGIFTASSDDTMIYIPHIEEALSAGNNVTIETGSTGNQAGNITANGFGFGFTNTIPVTFTLRAANDIQIENFGIVANDSPVNIVFEAGNDVTVRSGSLSTGSGSLSLTAGRSIALGSLGINTTGAPIILNAKQDIQISDGVSLNAGGSSISLIADEARSRQGKIEIRGAVFEATGGIDLIAPEKISISEAAINSTYDGTLQAAPIRLTAREIAIEEAQVISEPTNTGRGSDLIINAEKFSINLAAVESRTRGAGSAGDVFLNAGQMQLENFSLVSWTIGSGRGGDVTIQAKDVKLDLAGSISTQSGIYFDSGVQLNVSATGNAGNLTFRAETIEMAGQSNLGSETRSFGNAGNILLEAKTVKVGGQSQISNFTTAQGNAGNLTIVATESIDLLRGSFTTSTEGTGTGGNLNLTTDRFSIMGGGIQASTFQGGQGGKTTIQAKTINNDGGFILGTANGSGNAGDTTIVVDTLNFTNNAIVGNSTFGSGNAGNISITGKALNILSQSTINTESSTNATGNAANIQIMSDRLLLEKGFIGNGTKGSGNAGILDLNIKDLILQGGIISSDTAGRGNGGSIQVNADRLGLFSQSEIISNSLKVDSGNAGMIDLNVRNLLLDQSSRIATNTAGVGKGGEIEINAQQVKLDRNSLISSYGTNVGDAGSIQVNATDSIRLSNGSRMDVRTASGQGGNLSLNANWIELRSRSVLSAEANGNGDGGNISLTAPIIVGLGNSDIIANAFKGDGGNIKIKTDALLGLKFRDRLTPGNDITASSEFGISGNVIINTPSVDATAGVVALPEDVLATNAQINDKCANQGSKFVVTGRGGIKPSPSVQRSSLRSWSDIRIAETTQASITPPIIAAPTTLPTNPQILEADGFQTDPITGQVTLTASRSTTAKLTNPATCSPNNEAP